MIKKNDIIFTRKLRKDGSLDAEIHNLLVDSLMDGDMVAMPIDHVYGMAAAESVDAEERISEILCKERGDIIRIISSFKMLDVITIVDKFKFDFLHRIWPGDVIVKLKKKKPRNRDETILVSIPKHKYIQKIVEDINRPLLFRRGFDKGKFVSNKDKKLVKKYKDAADLIVVIEEFCKEHPSPTIVDLSTDSLSIVFEGKVPVEEIKSLYFLDKK